MRPISFAAPLRKSYLIRPATPRCRLGAWTVRQRRQTTLWGAFASSSKRVKLAYCSETYKSSWIFALRDPSLLVDKRVSVGDTPATIG